MRWAIQGYYGVGNLGDDLMLYLLVEQLMASDPNASFGIIHSYLGRPERIAVPAGARIATAPNRRLARVAWQIARADALLFGGGTCLHQHGNCGMRANLVARALRRPVFWIGIGADPVQGERAQRKARRSANTCRAIAVRDEESAAVLRSVGARPEPVVTDDIVYLLPDSPTLGRAAAAPRGGALLVGWRNAAPRGDVQTERAHAGAVAEALLRTAQRQQLEAIELLAIADVIDAPAMNVLADALRREAAKQQAAVEIRPLGDLDLRAKLRAIATAGLFLSGRLHGALVGKLLGTPTVAVRYAAKVNRFLDQLDRSAGVGVDDLGNAEALRAALEQEIATPARFRAPLERHSERARANLRVLEDSLRS